MFESALKDRSVRPELMDDFSSGGPELTEALRQLRRLNRLFAAAAPTLHGVRLLWARAGKPRKLTVLDVGSGSGDVNRKLLRWADGLGFDLTIVLVDKTKEACAEAKLYYADEPRVQVACGDLYALDAGSADIVTATQLAHHFEAGELVGAVEAMRRASRLGVVLGDIHRHWLAWSAVWVVTHLMSRNRYIRHDGPLSVAKGFTGADWQQLRDALQADFFYWSWRPMFRYSVVIGAEDDAHT
ncbi:methyltransferase domain-containing protein [Paenibacillus rigui]|uniref:Stilbene synthase n=1 Tax=Paenibacillus rigui TaxID=554312 RepID=A0A229UW03_9BACL|nr:methyltransferase domain-containing protein [Paenibacillus rigui]OXM87471.1 stilbene synthase [Paenibacillus rigui]